MKVHCAFLILFFSAFTLSAQDTVFIKKTKDWTAAYPEYETDTVIFPSGMMRNILTGTTVIPFTQNQQYAKGYGLFFEKVTKSDCSNSREEVYKEEDKINSFESNESNLTIEVKVYDNCCYDFLCDIAVDSNGTLNLIYQGYGSHCGCECCHGLTFELSKFVHSNFGEIKALMLNGDESTRIQISQ